MAQILKQIDSLTIREGNIYPVLARLQMDGLVISYSESSQNGPPRKYFKITDLGQQVLTEMNAHWDRLNDSVQHIRKGTHR